MNAIVALQDRDGLAGAGARARRAARARRDGGPAARLSHAVKDLAAGQGHAASRRARRSSRTSSPAADSIMVERLRKAGVIFIGKTNTPEFGLGSHTYNPVYGVTRNAYDQSRSAGGSSGGAAVALALRMLPLADGSDYGGSLRNPAGWNNVFGFRTSYRPRAGRRPRRLAAVDGRARADGADRRRPRPAAVGAGRLRRARAAVDGERGARFRWAARRRREGQAHRLGRRLRRRRALRARRAGRSAARALKTFEALGCVVEDAVPDYPLEKVWQAWHAPARLAAAAARFSPTTTTRRSGRC